MRYRLVWKLTACFGAALLLLSVATGAVFLVLFREYTIDLRRTDMEQRAFGISAAFAEGMAEDSALVWDESGEDKLLGILDQLTQADIWLVNREKKMLTHGHYSYESLSPDAARVVDRALGGQVVSCQSFSTLLETPTLTVGVPLKSAGGVVIGAVLLHASVEGIDDAVRRGLDILGVSIVSALVLATVFSLLLSYFMVKPLEKVRAAAQRMTKGDYTGKTGVNQRDEIGQLACTMDALTGRLAAVDQERAQLEKMRQDFITDISHELRTPVTVLRGSIEALRDGVVTHPEQVAQYLAQMIAESRYVERLVNDLLELSRLQNTDFTIEMSPFNLSDVISDVARGMRRLAEEKNILVAVENPFDEDWIMGDYGRIRQMLLIVLDNAIKFSHPGQRVELRLETWSQEESRLGITSFGPGIPAEELPHIFERFKKTNSEDNRDGTGLGLSIAHQIAQRHGVKIEVTSVQNCKTEFFFYFHHADAARGGTQ